MTHYRVQHTFQSTSNMPEDRYVNVFHINTPAVADETLFIELAFCFDNFYNVQPPGSSGTIAQYLAGNADGVPNSVKFYDMSDEKPRAPKFEMDFTHGYGGAGSALPAEVALCLSFAAPAVSGAPIARRRGRVYVGPFNSSALGSNDDAGNGRPLAALVNTIAAAGKQLAIDLLAADSTAWVVYSPTDDDVNNVSRVWCDNAWDTQRRRGCAPTSRVSLNLP